MTRARSFSDEVRKRLDYGKGDHRAIKNINKNNEDINKHKDLIQRLQLRPDEVNKMKRLEIDKDDYGLDEWDEQLLARLKRSYSEVEIHEKKIAKLKADNKLLNDSKFLKENKQLRKSIKNEIGFTDKNEMLITVKDENIKSFKNFLNNFNDIHNKFYDDFVDKLNGDAYKSFKDLKKFEFKDKDFYDDYDLDILEDINYFLDNNIDEIFEDNFLEFHKVLKESNMLDTELLNNQELTTYRFLYNSIKFHKSKYDISIDDYFDEASKIERFSENNNEHYNLFLHKDLRENSEFLFNYILLFILFLSITKSNEGFSNTNLSPSPSSTPSNSDEFLEHYSEVVSLCLEVLATKEKDSDLQLYRMKFYNKMKNFSEDIYDYILDKFNVPRNIFFMDENQKYYFNLMNKKKFKQINYVIFLYKKYYRDHEDKLSILKLNPKEQFKKVVEYGELEFERIQKQKEKEQNIQEKTFFQKYLVVIIIITVVLLILLFYLIFAG